MEVSNKIVIKPGELRVSPVLRRDLVPSLPRGILDAVMKKLGRIPRHCRACGNRFYVHHSALQSAT